MAIIELVFIVAFGATLLVPAFRRTQRSDLQKYLDLAHPVRGFPTVSTDGKRINFNTPE